MNLTIECRLVANYIIEKTNIYNEGKTLRNQILMSNKRLQKLLYFFDIEYMKENNGYSFFTDEFYAWPSGPVIPDIYRKYIQYQDGIMNPDYSCKGNELPRDVKLIIDGLLDATKEIDTVDLINICKVENGPWHQVYKQDDSKHQQIISKDEMYIYHLDKNLFNKDNNILTKEKIINDMNFRSKCCEIGLDWEDAEIYENVILVNSPNKYIYVMFDRYYNIIGVHKIEFATLHLDKEEIAKGYYELYNTVYNDSSCCFSYPFQSFSLRQMLEIANKIDIDEINHGHSIQLKVNGTIINENSNKDYIGLLSYIKFLSDEIQQYYLDCYKMKMMGFDYPNVYEYVNALILNIVNCIDKYIESGNRPFPVDILYHLGYNRRKVDEVSNELYKIIGLLLNAKGYRIKRDCYNKLELINKETPIPVLSLLVLDVLEMFNASEKQSGPVLKKIKERNR